MAAKRTAGKTVSSTAPKAATRRRRVPVVTHEDIATRAYYLHLEGGPDPFENWVRAERELVRA
jgi:hypothetical protein